MHLAAKTTQSQMYRQRSGHGGIEVDVSIFFFHQLMAVTVMFRGFVEQCL
jgi:hypothetical protein